MCLIIGHVEEKLVLVGFDNTLDEIILISVPLPEYLTSPFMFTSAGW